MSKKGAKVMLVVLWSAIFGASLFFAILANTVLTLKNSVESNDTQYRATFKSIVDKQDKIEKILLSQTPVKDGQDGRDGSTVVGAPGMNGINGTNGNSIVGPSGQDGKSAYQLWLDEGNTCEYEEYKESLRGETGRTMEFCYMPKSTVLGQRFVGSRTCTPIGEGE